jgi:hypothetical protein
MHSFRTALATFGLVAAGFAADPAAAPAEAPKPKVYPLDTCIVTGEKLGSMGEAIVKIHGSQEVKFCCKGCVRTFDKDPATYITKMEAAALAAKAAADAKATASPAK